VIRGPPGAGKTPLREELNRTLSKEMSVKDVVLDRHSGVSSDHRPRVYHYLDSLKEDCIVLELGNGGDATKNPHVWADKLKAQGYAFYLFRLDASLEELKKRTATRPAETGWKEVHTIGGWNSYKHDPNFMDLSKKLGLTETVIDTMQVSTSQAAQIVLKSLS
jgi:hypothetical protein